MMMPDITMRSIMGNSGYGEELGKTQEAGDREKEPNIYRSGSAPPTVEGSLSAVGGLFGESNPVLGFDKGGDAGGKDFVSDEELRSDPAYVSYYYSNANLNPRLPPPLLSREEVRLAQRLQGGGTGSVLGGIGDRRKVNIIGEDGGNTDSFSMSSMQKHDNGLGSRKTAEWGGQGLIGLPGLGPGIIQDELIQAKSVSRHSSRPASRNAFEDKVETSGAPVAQNVGSSAAHTYASALGASLSRSTTPDPRVVARTPSPRIPLVGGGKNSLINKRSVNGPDSFTGVAPGMSESSNDLAAALSGLTLSTNGKIHEENHMHSKVQHDFDDHKKLFSLQSDQNHIKPDSYLNSAGSGQFNLHAIPQPVKGSYSSMSKGSGVGIGLNNSSLMANGGSSPSHYHDMGATNSSFSNYGLSGYAVNPSSPSMMGSQLGIGDFPSFENVAAASAMGVSGMDLRALGRNLSLGPNPVAAADKLQNLNGLGNHSAGNALQAPFIDPRYLQYLRSTDYAGAQVGALNDPTVDREYMASLYMDVLQKAYLGASLSPQKLQYSAPYAGKSASLNHGYYVNPALDLSMSYPGSPLAAHLLPNSPIGPVNPVRHGERNLRSSSGVRNSAGAVMGAWAPGAGANFDENFASSLLGEFKSNKTKCFELSEIDGHVVEFSADQYGSRFIQQKLETATAEERDMVFHEIMPHALSLITDVFGNYVIQKFFEHGTASQIRGLADQLIGHVLTLSLQMYGCRVIQKAIEVVELDQQTRMVAELDGHIMRCVRDQNGNHVIQKCIECIPEEAIQFIVSTFYDQVVTLSTHPYGCRVIQRILEHCSNPKTQGIMMGEILDHVYMLAQDQYGNYVVQHVLEHGKPEERSIIINKLTGQIVQMSQQKFASNVVEKCLAFGNPVERQILVNEMLGATDENEPLQVMMKDQFANYVVQKVLETCDDQQLELILNRIKVHLTALKKYTYGKHIVSRVEKLVAAGERRISVMCPNPAA